MTMTLVYFKRTQPHAITAMLIQLNSAGRVQTGLEKKGRGGMITLTCESGLAALVPSLSAYGALQAVVLWPTEKYRRVV